MALSAEAGAGFSRDFLASLPGEGPLGIVCVDRCACGENPGSIKRSAHAFGYRAIIKSGSADSLHLALAAGIIVVK